DPGTGDRQRLLADMDAPLDFKNGPVVDRGAGVRGAQGIIVLDVKDALLHVDRARVPVETGKDQPVWPHLGDPETAGNALGNVPAQGKLTGAGIDTDGRVVGKDDVARDHVGAAHV